MNCSNCGKSLISDGHGDYVHKDTLKYKCQNGIIPTHGK